eukprot:TRINITY_DN924_c0_g1_i2.p1 TRINITY_DN924_c0_g1~~TRINITY_DN924_c0_g1_i2.p1  ORF type:complete len:203 (-),score=32.99 TRINITY_DN924_c0_g1_i2:112-720(-)
MVRKEGQDRTKLSFFQLFLSGSAAGMFQASSTYPLEFIRTRLSLASGLGEQKYKGILHCAVVTYQKEGFFAFYKGIGPTILSGTPYVGLQMTFFDLFKRRAPKNEKGNISIGYSMICGALAGLGAQTITFPGDTVRRRMMTNGLGGKARQYKNSIDCCKQIVMKEGWRAFFYGVKPNIVRCIPGASIQFATYETIKQFLEVQ